MTYNKKYKGEGEEMLKKMKIIFIWFIFFSSQIFIYAQDSFKSPFGIASGAEWSKEFPRFNPILKKNGIRWLRYFPEWNTIQSEQDKWNWEFADELVADCKKNGLHLSGGFAYFARFASADGGTRKGPIKDIEYWRKYVKTVAERYKNDIKYWEVWNEFNGSFYQGNNKAQEYADLVKAAYEEVKKVSPDIKIGISCANFDLGFFDAAIKAGAGGHFDFVAVHPYENLASVINDGDEANYLNMAASLRKMLKENKQNGNIALWITETGIQSTIQADETTDALQAEALIKVYILSIVQGFEKIFWFEARGPAYGKNTDHGLIRHDWTERPALRSLQTMVSLIGEVPIYTGWLKVGNEVYGFLFSNNNSDILVAWAKIDTNEKIVFQTPIKIINYIGEEKNLSAGEEIILTRRPLFILNIPRELIEQAYKNKELPFPWGTDYSNVDEVYCRLGATNMEKGIKQVRLETSAVENGLTESWRKTNFAHGSEGRYMYFRVDPSFASFGTKELEITVVAKRVSPDKSAGMILCYESLNGYRGVKNGWWTIPEDDKWHSHTWVVNDANFVGGWGWNFRTDAISSPNEFYIKEVKVKKINKKN